MEPIAFWKMSGSGNDFILVDNRDRSIEDEAMGPLVKKICRRRESVGADGVIFVTESERFDFGWRFFNADGGEVEMCGNGARCVARFAHLKGMAESNMTFETLAGPIAAEVTGHRVKVSIPVPTALEMDIDLPLETGWLSADFIHTGVPHVVIQVDSLSDYPVFQQGKSIRYHPMFSPDGTNANFIRIISPDLLEIRTYERGVEDETLACGTGAVAAALVSGARGMVESPVRAKTQGGEELRISFQKEQDEFTQVWFEGKTVIVYQGQLHEEALQNVKKGNHQPEGCHA
jgi:diaminopimelate epimerase